MSAPFAFYYLLTWCDAFKCRVHEFRFALYEDCARFAVHMATTYEGTAWCNPIALSPF
jgi:hypothetical protein